MTALNDSMSLVTLDNSSSEVHLFHYQRREGADEEDVFCRAVGGVVYFLHLFTLTFCGATATSRISGGVIK